MNQPTLRLKPRWGGDAVANMKAGKLSALEENLFGDKIITVPHDFELDEKSVQSYYWEVRA